MSFNYRFIEHTADIAIEASGSSIEELFIAAAEGWKAIALEDAITNPAGKLELNLVQDSIEELLVNFLDELNFQLNTKKWIFSAVQLLRIIKEDSHWKLFSLLKGEYIDPVRHEVKVEIKAVTFHQVEIKKEEDEYKTMVVFDI